MPFIIDDIAIAAAAAEAAAAAQAAAAATAAATAATAGTAAAGTAAAGAGAAGAGAMAGGLLGAGATTGTGAAAADAALAGYGGGMLGADAASAGLLGTAPESAGAMAYTTPSIFPGATAGGELSGTLAGTDLAYGSPAALAQAPSVAPPTMMEQFGGYAKDAGKAASTFSAVNGAMGGNQPQRPPPQGRPVFQGEAPPIAQQQMQPQQNQYALALLEQQKRARGMLG